MTWNDFWLNAVAYMQKISDDRQRLGEEPTDVDSQEGKRSPPWI